MRSLHHRKSGGGGPLHFYALLEVLVAFLGCTVVFGLPVLGDWMRPLWQTLWNYQPMLLGLRFVVSFSDFTRANHSHGFDAAGYD